MQFRILAGVGLIQWTLVCLAVTIIAKPPNIVVILADDQGWGDLSISGNTNLSTPNIDSLATDGASLENYYVCQLCAPTRAEFLTGRYHPRSGVRGVSRGEERMESSELTIAELLRDTGYTTGIFGKWHNGTQSPYHPLDQGFEEFYGFTSGHWGHYFSPPIESGFELKRGNGYLPNDLTSRAIDFIERSHHKAFFCYLPLNTPHSPMMVPDRWFERFVNEDPRKRHREPEREDLDMTKAALAMCENIDWNVGRVLTCLDDLQLSDNTIVVFFSDNGPNSYRFNGGMKGKKGSIDEGGLRSPCFVRWPNQVKGGSKIESNTSAMDWLPTLCELAGIEDPEAFNRDGVSLAQTLIGESGILRDRKLFAISKKGVSVRWDSYRLDPDGRLFNIKSDRGQYHDIADSNPKITKELNESAEVFRTQMESAWRRFENRPFTVGDRELTRLPARDGIPHGTIQRSSKAPNNSFFTNWTRGTDSISWDVRVLESALYEVMIRYTCRKEDAGVVIRFEDERGASTQREVTEAFDPPLYEKPKERVTKSHYFVKDFKALSLGNVTLESGKTAFRLTAKDFRGSRAIDVHSIEMKRK
ncbi:MAG: arylsulfatase [Planctomycetota bacterium]